MGISYRFANNLIVLVHSQALINNLLARSTSQNQAKNTTQRAGRAGGKCGGAMRMTVCEPLSEAANGVPKMVNSVV